MSGLGRCPDLRIPNLGGSTVYSFKFTHDEHKSENFDSPCNIR